jgi:signal transduction histidine kinase
LQLRLRHSSEDIADVNERTLQRIGGDLHDGPAQLLSYAMLRVNKLGERIEAGDFMQASKDLKRMRLAVEDSLREIRNISSGLTLPELQDVPLDRSIELAIRTHEEHTTTVVAREIDLALDTTPHPIKICIYRFVQEGLANAYWHAGGEGQKVTAQGGVPLVVSVSDAGPGINALSASSSGLGLTGMRARIEAHGGLLRVEKGGCNGTVLTASFCQNALRPRENNHGSTQ